MTSSTGQTALSIDHLPNSEPESFDSLDYDDWEGQFEFVGCNAAQNTTTRSNDIDGGGGGGSGGDLDDLNLTAPNYTQPINYKRPILIDEETFLSLQSTDGNNIDYSIDHISHPFQTNNQSHIIENALKHLQFDKTTVPLTTTSSTTTDELNAMPNDSSHFDRILRLKNRLNNTKCNPMQPSDTNNNHTNNNNNNDNKQTNRNSQSRFNDCHSFVWNDDDDDQMDIKMNGRRYSNDLCDTLLKEQVSRRFL